MGGTPGSLQDVSFVLEYGSGSREWNTQPVEFPVMCELEDEFVDHAINADCSTYELELGIC